MGDAVRLICGDAVETLRTLDAGSVHCVVTSPPYFALRDYGVAGQIGLEKTPAEFVAKLVEVFREVRRVLRDDGTLWLNLGDSFASGKVGRGDADRPNSQDLLKGVRRIGCPKSEAGTVGAKGRNLDGLCGKQLLGMPWRVAFALQDDGWILRSDIIWAKPNPMPESVRDRPTKSHEHLFLFAKQSRYFYDAEAISEPAAEASGWAKQRSRGIDTWKYNDSAERIASTGQRTESSTHGVVGRRNRRDVWTIAEPKVRLRRDLSPEQRAYVVGELLRRGLL